MNSKPLSKEIILDIENKIWDGSLNDAALVSMDIYAKQEAIEFAEFISGEGWQQYDGHDRWICPQESNKVISTQQLYTIYQQSKEVK